MQRIDLFGFYRLGQYVHPATQLLETDLTISKLTSSQLFLRLLTVPPYEPLPLPLMLSIASAMDAIKSQENLTRYASRLFSTAKEDAAKDSTFAAAIKGAERAALDFEAVLEKELLTLGAFCVSPKGAYNTFVLLEQAEAAIAESVRPFIPDHALQDFREAGRCLALEVPTACGYHITRAVEAVLREWHVLLVGPSQGSSTPKPLNWGVIEKGLINAGAPRGTVGILTQIRELHRNPIMHPEIFLSIEEAMSLFDISKSAIEAMAREIEKLKTAGTKP